MICLWNTTLIIFSCKDRVFLSFLLYYAFLWILQQLKMLLNYLISMQIAYNIVCSKDAILIVWLIEGSSKSHFNLSTILVFGIIRLLAKNIFCIHTLETGNDDRLTHTTALYPGGFRKCCRENGLNNIFIFGLFYPSQWKELWQLFKNLTPGINNIMHKHENSVF